ncbi:MAG TPA: hypothetical protein VJ785_11120, partial [Anaerolineales bacterium]|nr:hypothetical protein [Anaerolineales bacterium]
MTEILQLLLAILLLTLSVSAYILVISVLFPSRVTKTQRIVRLSQGRSFGLGMVNFLFFGLIVILLFSAAEAADGFGAGVLLIPALLVTIFLVILLSLGLTSVVNELAERLFPDLSNWKRILWSAVLLCLACTLPFVGWFLLLPYVGFVGIGATIRGRDRRGRGARRRTPDRGIGRGSADAARPRQPVRG